MDGWKEIISDYCKARKCFWGPRHGGGWYRNEEDGYYYLWKAYHEAKAAEEKDPLWYGRILYLMASEHRYKFSNLEILKKFAAPAVEQFHLCTPESGLPTEKELECAEDLYSWLKYEDENQEGALYPEQIKLIEGHEMLNDFWFHDSKPIRFEHDEKNAKLWLDYCGTIAELQFEDVCEIDVKIDPTCTWIFEFYLYRDCYRHDLLTFNIDYYRIKSKKVKVLSVSKASH